MIEEKRDHNPGARHPEAVGELISVLREMLEYAEAINTDKRARTVNLKFSRLTLEMWMEKARAALSEAETSVLPTEPSASTSEASTAHEKRHRVEYGDSSGSPRFSCSCCNDTIIRPPDISDERWDEAVEVFKRQHGVV